jgi:hypothetical protein
MNPSTEATRKRRKRLIAGSWCVDCGLNHLVYGHILCKECLRAKADRENERRQDLLKAARERDPKISMAEARRLRKAVVRDERIERMMALSEGRLG